MRLIWQDEHPEVFTALNSFSEMQALEPFERHIPVSEQTLQQWEKAVLGSKPDKSLSCKPPSLWRFLMICCLTIVILWPIYSEANGTGGVVRHWLPFIAVTELRPIQIPRNIL
jgi:hypothetical protein